MRAIFIASSMSLLLACASSTPQPNGAAAMSPTVTSPPTPTPTATAQNEPLVGHVARADVEALPKWIEARKQEDPDVAASKALANVSAGAKVRVIFGTWCGDSRREVTRFWKALDVAGKVPFDVEYVAVDMGKKAPDGLVDGVELRYVPTFIVLRDGKEVGRIVESSPNGIEVDLGKLLRGERGGVLSKRSDVGAT